MLHSSCTIRQFCLRMDSKMSVVDRRDFAQTFRIHPQGFRNGAAVELPVLLHRLSLCGFIISRIFFARPFQLALTPACTISLPGWNRIETKNFEIFIVKTEKSISKRKFSQSPRWIDARGFETNFWRSRKQINHGAFQLPCDGKSLSFHERENSNIFHIFLGRRLFFSSRHDS